MTEQHHPALIDITVEIVSSFVSQNVLRANELPDLIESVYASLAGLTTPKPVEQPLLELKAAVTIKKSITDDYLICLDDGLKFRSLKRHLAVLGMTPQEYRAKWGLAPDYPMVAPGYSVKRSELARATGLGTQRQKPAPSPSVAPAPAATSRPRVKKAA